MSMQMDRMLVSTAVTKDKPVTLAFLDDERIGIWPGLIVNGPCIELRSMHGPDVAKSESKGFVWLGYSSGVCKLRIVPFCRRRIPPDWIALLPCIFNDDAQAHLACLF